MKRPHLVHFQAIMTKETLCIRASVTMKENLKALGQEIDLPAPSFPIQAFRLLGAYSFSIKIVGLDSHQKEVYKKVFDSDSFGNYHIKIPLTGERNKISVLQIYEIGKNPGLEIHLGTYIPLQIQGAKKFIICDFDKTLVDTRYSTTKEMYNSLTKPLNYFPTINNSVDLLRKYIDEGFHPFILSASPHFYEDAMRDWLYQNKIYTAGIFLKDYRKVFSFFENDLTPKDLKAQGLYKLNHLLDILLMTGIPDELVLMGDNFESDPIIYLTLAMLLKQEVAPWSLWNTVKKQDAFQLNRKQNSQFLNKIYQLTSMLKRHKEQCENFNLNLKIFIRKKTSTDQLKIPNEFQSQIQTIELYEGPSYPPGMSQLTEDQTGSEKQDITDA